MRSLTIDGKEINISENFNELSADQVKCFIDAFYLKLPHFFWLNDEGNREVISNDCYNGLLYGQLLNILQIEQETFEKLTASDVLFLIDEMKVIHFLLDNSTLTRNHFQKINDNLVGPEDDFGDITGNKFLWAEHYYIEFQNNKTDITNLDAMIACLCTRMDFSNVVIPFDLKTISETQKIVAELDITIKTGIMLYFEGCRNEIPVLYPHVFQGKKKDDVSFKEVLLQVAKDGPFGDFDKVLDTNIHLIYSELERVRKEAIEFEKRNKK